MLIITDPPDFKPKDFVIHTFYGKETCFAWNDTKFVCFEYPCQGSSTDKLEVYNVPSEIKDIRCFAERIYLLCYPSGIYKLTETFCIALLSKTGIELGADFCEVITSSNDMIVLEDKKMKNTKKLFFTSETSIISVLALNSDSAHKKLLKALFSDDVGDDIKFCFISNNKHLYKMVNQDIEIIFNCDCFIKKIYPVEKGGKVVGAILQTDSNLIILMHVVQTGLKYEKIFLDNSIERLCAVIDETEENILLLHSDGQKTYYSTKKLLSDDSLQELRTEDKNYYSFKLYRSKNIIFLNNTNELSQIGIKDAIPKIKRTSEDYIKLEPKMLKGIDNILLELTEKSAELSKLKEEILRKENLLNRINMFTYNQYLKYCPEESVIRVLNNTFLRSNYKKDLPENTILVKMLKNKGKAIFIMKKVDNFNTVIEMPICLKNLSSELYTTTDLISHINEGGPWCLIKNYIRDPKLNKRYRIKLSEKEIGSMKHSLLVLKELKRDGELTMEALTQLKKKTREEIDYKFKRD